MGCQNSMEVPRKPQERYPVAQATKPTYQEDFGPKVIRSAKQKVETVSSQVNQTKQTVINTITSAPPDMVDIGPIHPDAIGKYLNQARKDPRSFIPYIEKQLAKFKDNTNIQLWKGFNYGTNEGKAVWQEAIEFLKKQQPVQPLTLHNGLCISAVDHAIDLAVNDMMGHVGSDGSTVRDRIDRYCVYTSGFIGQNVAQEFNFEGRDHALEVVISLIIDDGVEGRGHRLSIFDKNYNYYGVGSRLTSDSYIVVINYSTENLKERPGVKAPTDAAAQARRKVVVAPGQRVIVSKQTNVETRVRNGVETKITKVTKKYNDGTTEVEEVAY